MKTSTSALQIKRATIKTSVRAGETETRSQAMSSSYLMSCLLTCNIK